MNKLEIRITSWDINEIKTLFNDSDSYIIAKEIGKENLNKHVHIYLETLTKMETFRSRLKSKYKGIYKMSKINNHDKYLKYIAKDWSVDNPWIQHNMNEDAEEWQRFWLEDGEHLIVKGRNKLTNKIIDIIMKFENDDDLLRKIANTCMSINGMWPHKVYFNQVVNTYMAKCVWTDDQQDEVCSKMRDYYEITPTPEPN